MPIILPPTAIAVAWKHLGTRRWHTNAFADLSMLARGVCPDGANQIMSLAIDLS
jgi:hypothetical protein